MKHLTMDSPDASHSVRNLNFPPETMEHKVLVKKNSPPGSRGIGSHDNSGFSMDQEVEYPGTPVKRRLQHSQSVMQAKEERESRRNRCLTNVRETLKLYTSNNVDSAKTSLTKLQVQNLFAEKKFSLLMFMLFDDKNTGTLEQADWIAGMKGSTSSFSDEVAATDLAELLEAVTYLVCQEELVQSESFHKIWSSRGVAGKITKLMGSIELITEEDFMEFVMKITAATNRKDSTLDKENIDYLEKVFRDNVGGEKEFTLSQFKKIVSSKNEFFVERAFRIFDKDASGTVSLAEFIETMHQFSGQGEDEKISFLFKVYDLNNSGEIDESEVRQMMKACMKESGMEFDDSALTELAKALYEDAVRDGCDGITVEDLKLVLMKHDGLIENMNISIGKWLVPPRPKPKSTFAEKILANRPKFFTRLYWENNTSFAGTMLLIILINITLFIHRAYYFRNFSNLDGTMPNPFYMISRGFGRVLLFNSVLVLVMVLRYTLTLLRNLGLGSYIPVDHNIYFHKIIGWTIFGSAWIHSIMHFCNFAINVQPNPVRFLQLTSQYWKDYYKDPSPFGYLLDMGYHPPPGCSLVDTGMKDRTIHKNMILQTMTILNNTILQFCPPEDRTTLDVCQACHEEGSAPWSWFDIIFTMKPGVFGMPGGMANPSGVALLTIITVMTVCSLPFVRRSGYFQVFYFTHMLYFFYWGILFIHAPEWSKWFLAFGIIFVIERSYRIIHACIGHGKTVVQSGILLPSKVTNLVIKRPHGFNFSPGDWVFIKIPKLTSFEWHPFTISSAPEVQETFTLHIRGVGSWTEKLYKYFEVELANEAQKNKKSNSKSVFVKKKWDSTKIRLSKSMVAKPKTEGSSDFVDLANKYRLDVKKQQLRLKARQDSLNQLQILHEEKKQFSKSDIIDIELQNENKTSTDFQPLEIFIDGPFGSPSSDIYRAEHGVLIATGIGITPYASILQSIMLRYWKIKTRCPSCQYQWTDDLSSSMFNLKKVDFIWINRDQKSFEWFVKLLSQLEIEQAEQGGQMGNFLDMHMYITSALQKTDMKAVGLQLGLDLLHQKDKRDLVTGLKSRTNAGRPNWNKVFTKIREQNKGRVTVFYCGNPALSKILQGKCAEFGFTFKKEIF